ncbi:MAG: helix-turn-helix transcriptional regulator [Clostridia bacterium]|jgi:transcriptional regulator with XRE-family HTH domain|nr:helix-turn-helix transcriptional regulator [Clostridia bacterium]
MSIRKVNGKLNVIDKNVKKLRKERCWSQADLARELNLIGLPFHKNDVQSIEANTRTVREIELWFLAQVFNVKMEDLITNIEVDINITV